MPIAQIGDAAAADLAYRSKWFGHTVAAQRSVNPIADPLQRCAVVRCAKKDDVLQLAAPGRLGLLSNMASAAADQAAHAVRQQGKVFDGLRPLIDELLQKTSKLLAVDGRVQPRVVVQVNRGVAQRFGQ